MLDYPALASQHLYQITLYIHPNYPPTYPQTVLTLHTLPESVLQSPALHSLHIFPFMRALNADLRREYSPPLPLVGIVCTDITRITH